MSQAFVKESDGEEGPVLPELLVSPHRNLVTPFGLKQIETNVESLQAALSAARAADDRAAMARIQRDLRYWSERLRTAEVVMPVSASGTVRFGTTVELSTRDWKRIEYQIVGEDEADPAHGRISYVSPIARLLIGASIGDDLALAGEEVEVVAIK